MNLRRKSTQAFGGGSCGMMVHLGKYGAREEFFPQKASAWALKSNDAYGDSNNNNHPDRRRISVGCMKTARCTRS
ncbi:AGAP013334-PA [Anopheles gambiae str. PEST]|uniref:AGAP013334-PA n=2 Tax=Anopheles gambiae TaxID=7165 RepID=F5HM20_ANOGA|nr:AGAP013334-PA [Anopheles gambiae str. PEST]